MSTIFEPFETGLSTVVMPSALGKDGHFQHERAALGSMNADYVRQRLPRTSTFGAADGSQPRIAMQ